MAPIVVSLQFRFLVFAPTSFVTGEWNDELRQGQRMQQLSIDQIDRILELRFTQLLGEQMALEAVTEFCDLQQLTGPQFDSLCAVNDCAKHGGNGGMLLIGGVV